MLNNIQPCTIELSNGEILGYRECGSGPETLVLVHGNLSSSRHWDILMEELAPKYKIYALDLRGFGMSSYNKPISCLRDFAHDLHLFIQSLKLKNFTLAGWSTGGGVSMEYVINYPNVAKKLILFQSVGIKGLKIYKKPSNRKSNEPGYFITREEMHADTQQIQPLLNAQKNGDKQFFKKIWDNVIYNLNQPPAERYDGYLEEMLNQRNNVDVYYALTHFNISKEHNEVVEGNGLVERINIPTLIIHGKEDLVVPLKDALYTKENLGELAELAVIDDAGHAPLTDKFEEVKNHFVRFIDG
ncbi:alpha/beta hydrolase [Serpentinicella sp. ANB-PHB4]|uniref:intracellular short-chain-length polyhydroxyalkanoate depolymerase n=1 Tax=Serpentinicella sp. ANB-PHB4 TaxID=3074076 RepID=UPI002865BFC6|nr:alpha/beta hydrolase [Serpentinicella sp. ANB-PHB4]MDR5659901.1 alpha/beta hydrolase [Serpentinicella sp. ANB-PHB4]